LLLCVARERSARILHRQCKKPPVEAASELAKKAAASLRHGLDDELSRLRAFQSDRVDFLLGCRRMPGLCFRETLECNDDKPLRCRSVNRDDVVGAHDELSVESSNRLAGFRTKRLECFGIGNFAEISDGIDRSGLG